MYNEFNMKLSEAKYETEKRKYKALKTRTIGVIKNMLLNAYELRLIANARGRKSKMHAIDIISNASLI